jgi:serine/threonine protein kinase
MSRPVSEAIPTINGFRYLEPLGSGGYSDVYLYEQDMPRRKVAVKVLRRSDLDETLRRQFIAEANAMAALADHPNIVPVFSTGQTDDGRPFLLMSYYSRPNLGIRAAEARLSVAEVLRIGIQIASAVETAHRAGILHRDIKPANILTSQYGAPGLTDFGIAAQLASVDTEDEDTGVSVPWAPPEVLYATAPASVRSDVYSLAATLWHLLVSRSPFEVPGGDNKPYALMRRIRDTPPPSTGRAEVPTGLERLLQQAMAKDPAARPASALAFARSLLAVEQEQRLPRTEIVVLAEEQTSENRRGINAGDDARTSVRTPKRIPLAPPPAPESTARRFVEHPVTKAPLERHDLSLDDTSTRSPSTPGKASAPNRARPLPSTVRRPAKPAAGTAAGEEPQSPPEPRGSHRFVVMIAAGAVIALSVVVGVVLSSGGKSKAHASESSSPTTSPQNAGNAIDNIPPGVPTVNVRRIGNVLRFSWPTYAAPLAGDTFRWRTADGQRSGSAGKPTVDLPAAAGTRICLQVKVIRADGSNAAVDWSPEKCGS